MSKRRRRREIRTLTALRVKLGMSQEELAAEIGCYQPEVSLYETGALTLPAARAERILRILASHPDSSLMPDGVRASDLQRPWDETLLHLTTVRRATEEG